MKKITMSALLLLSSSTLFAEGQESLTVVDKLDSNKTVVTTAIENKIDVNETTVPAINVENKLSSTNATQMPINTGVKIGTLGLGVDISTPINDKLSARFNLNGASYTDKQTEDENEFEGTLDLLTAGVLLDYYPFKNNFRLSGGAYYNGNGFTGNIKPSADTVIDINGQEYTVDDIGSLDSDISFDKVAPYIGLGWGNNANSKGWGFTFDLGVMYHGEGEANLTPKGIASIVNIPLLDSNVAAEEKDINDDLSKMKLYPVVALGVNYTF